MYMVLGILGLFVLWREIDHGPVTPALSNQLPAAATQEAR
jgi:hypothetical protein